MKKLILLAIILLQTVFSFSQRSSSSKELFIEILSPGKYTVYVNDEMIGSSRGRFRFYDVAATAPTITILQNNKQIIKTSLNLKSNSRTIASYGNNGGLKIIKTLALFANHQYMLDSWDQSNTQMGRPTNGKPVNEGRPTRTASPLAMSDATFKEFYAAVKGESFDDNKEIFIKTSLRNNLITSAQLVALLGTVSFEDTKISIAKTAYASVIDKQNFFKVYPILKFSSSRTEVMDYVNNQS